MRFNKWTAMRICKRCYTSFIPTETQRKRHDTSYCTECAEIISNFKLEQEKSEINAVKKEKVK